MPIRTGAEFSYPGRRGTVSSGSHRSPPTVHELNLAWTAGDSPNKPVAPCPRLVVVAEIHEREQRESGEKVPLRLTLLAPYVVEAILNGRQPAAITLAALMRPFAVEWQQQQAKMLADAIEPRER